MSITIPSGTVPLRSITTGEVLAGDRVTSYRWEVLEHADGTDSLVGYLDGVIDGGASLSWTLNRAVKGTGSMKVTDVVQPKAGMMSLQELALLSARIRPVLVIEGLPEIPLGVYLPSAAPEEWSAPGRQVTIDMHDRATVLEQDEIEESFSVDTSTAILAAVASVIASAGESIAVDAEVTDTLASPMVWPAGTSKLQIVNDLLGALNYSSLWVDGVGNFRATPYVVPAKRSRSYELLAGVPRELVDGESSIYLPEWARDQDLYAVPNKVIAVQAATGDAEPLVGVATNTSPTSPLSYAARGRWITRTVSGVETPAGSDAEIEAFLEAKALQSLIAMSAVQATVQVKHLPIPVRVSDVLRFANTPADVEGRYTITSLKLAAHPLGLMESTLQEVIDL